MSQVNGDPGTSEGAESRALAAQQLAQWTETAELIDGLRRELDNANAEIVAMRASVSWRVTTPLRAVRTRTIRQ
jgi:hypothetical protein